VLYYVLTESISRTETLPVPLRIVSGSCDALHFRCVFNQPWDPLANANSFVFGLCFC